MNRPATGRASSSTRNVISAAAPTRAPVCLVPPASLGCGSPGRKNAKPSTAPPTTTATCAAIPLVTSSATAASTAIAIRGLSGASVLPMPHSASATTAAATIFKPCSQSLACPLSACTPYANRMRATADGRVKPSHAAKPPA